MEYFLADHHGSTVLSEVHIDFLTRKKYIWENMEENPYDKKEEDSAFVKILEDISIGSLYKLSEIQEFCTFEIKL